MKDPIIFRDKAQALLDKSRSISYDANSFESCPDMDAIVEDFLHLVFFFDKDMPLYKDMIGKDDIVTRNLSVETLEFYITKFIHYLDEYCIDEEE